MAWRLEQLHSLLSGASCKNGVLSFFERMLGTACSIVVLCNLGRDLVERIDEDLVCKYCVVSYERFRISPNDRLFLDALNGSLAMVTLVVETRQTDTAYIGNSNRASPIARKSPKALTSRSTSTRLLYHKHN
jgi:hypothetical protein